MLTNRKLMQVQKGFILLVTIFAITITGCKKWGDALKVGNQDLSQNLTQSIAANSNLSKFSDFMKKTGVDVILQSSKTYTVWAPSNDALQSLDPSIVNDTARLKSFVLNHISNQSYFTRNAQLSIRVGMLNGKYNNFFANKIEDANITSADKFVRNGVLHVIDKAILVLPNVWEFITGTTSQYIQNNYIASLNFTSFDPSLAIIDSVSSTTGLPIYHPGTGVVIKNSFNERVFDLRKEDKQYTYFVIADAGFTSKSDSLKPYFKTLSLASTDSLAKWNIVKDLVIDTLYPNVASLPISFLSKFGITVPINKALIIDSRKLSNGMAYVLSLSDVPTASKFKQTLIQGEFPAGFLADRTANTNYRIRLNPATGLNFSDIMVSGHGLSGYYSYYRITEMPSMKYNVYAFAVNDFQTAAITQNIIFNYFTPPSTFTLLATLPYPVPLSTAAGAYNEVLLGQVTTTLFGTLDIRLVASGTNPIVLDYLRLVPIP